MSPCSMGTNTASVFVLNCYINDYALSVMDSGGLLRDIALILTNQILILMTMVILWHIRHDSILLFCSYFMHWPFYCYLAALF